MSAIHHAQAKRQVSCQRGSAIAAEPSRWLRLPGLLYTVAFGRCENLKAFDPACVAARLVASVGRWAVQVKDGSQNGRHRTNDTFVRKPVRYSSSMCLSCAAPFIEQCTICRCLWWGRWSWLLCSTPRDSCCPERHCRVAQRYTTVSMGGTHRQACCCRRRSRRRQRQRRQSQDDTGGYGENGQRKCSDGG